MSRLRQLTVHEDARGALLPVELDDIDFPVRRVFVVTAPEAGAERGGHVVSCRELVVLTSGHAQIHVGSSTDELSETVVLDTPGSAVHLETGEFMAYRLAASSSVLVLAEEPFAETAPPEQP
jgi:hypothetical protein